MYGPSSETFANGGSRSSPLTGRSVHTARSASPCQTSGRCSVEKVSAPTAATVRFIPSGTLVPHPHLAHDTSRYHREMPQPRTWEAMRRQIAGILVRRTGTDVNAWNARIADRRPGSEPELRAWLTEQGVSGYPQMLLVMETFGYPGYLVSDADALIDRQYADRPSLRPILEAILVVAPTLGEVEIQARQGYVTLLTPRRTFASVEATRKSRVDLGLRLPDEPAAGRLETARSMRQSAVTHRIGLASPDEVDDEVLAWLERAHDVNT
jgi:Domain of unknown function (DUF5655)